MERLWYITHHRIQIKENKSCNREMIRRKAQEFISHLFFFLCEPEPFLVYKIKTFGWCSNITSSILNSQFFSFLFLLAEFDNEDGEFSFLRTGYPVAVNYLSNPRPPQTQEKTQLNVGRGKENSFTIIRQ